MRDANKHVQEAACSALATLEEAAGRELLESSRITAILKTLAAALQVLLFTRILFGARCDITDARTSGNLLSYPVVALCWTALSAFFSDALSDSCGAGQHVDADARARFQ